MSDFLHATLTLCFSITSCKDLSLLMGLTGRWGFSGGHHDSMLHSVLQPVKPDTLAEGDLTCWQGGCWRNVELSTDRGISQEDTL